MKITSLMDNISYQDDFNHQDDLKVEHGLSLWIETNGQKILFDFGASDSFLENARALGIDLKEADMAFLSHGHYDHSGGMKSFLALNDKAKIHLQVHAFEEHLAQRQSGVYEYIGILPKEEIDANRIVFCDQVTKLRDHFILFSQVSGEEFSPKGNASLYMGSRENPILDDFRHEQNLLIQEEGEWYLIAGCAHKGILNIVKAAKDLCGVYPKEVFGGFHLYNKSTGTNETAATLKELSQELMKTGAIYYTGHCTGIIAFEEMKAVMKEQLEYFSCGSKYEK